MKLAHVFDALGDPTRRKILKLLRKAPLSAGEIADAFHLSKPTLSHHFRVLKAAGLVRSERRGTSIFYTLQSNVVEDAAAVLFELVEPIPAARKSARREPT